MSNLQAAQEQAAGPDSLPGAALKQAREAQGWSVAEVASQLHLTESAVQSLEADRYADLPGVTFVRGYIRAYAKLAGLDPDVLARQYSQTTITEPVRALPDLGRSVARSRSRGRLFVTLLLMVVLGVLVAGYFWWEDEQGRQAVQLGAEDGVAFNQVEIERVDGTLYIQSLDELDAYTADLEVAEIGLDSLQQPADEDAASAESAESAEDDALAGAAVEVDETAVASTEAADGADADGTADALAATIHRLELTFTDECWIRITDGTGSEVASGLRKAGETLQLSGTTPFELHLGNASGVQLRFNGQPVDIHSSIRGNVARIKLG